MRGRLMSVEGHRSLLCESSENLSPRGLFWGAPPPLRGPRWDETEASSPPEHPCGAVLANWGGEARDRGSPSVPLHRGAGAFGRRKG